MKIHVKPSGPFSILEVANIGAGGEIDRYTKSPGDDFSGQPPEVLDARDQYHTPDVVAAYQQHLADEAAASILTHAEYLANGLAKVDAMHADFMRALTGNATVEERDTWTAKVAAAKLIDAMTDAEVEAEAAKIVAGDETSIDDLETLVGDVGLGVAELRALADVVLTKSRAYKRLVGVASRIRREAKAAVTAATDAAQPIEGVGAALDQIETNITAQIQAEIAALGM